VGRPLAHAGCSPCRCSLGLTPLVCETRGCKAACNINIAWKPRTLCFIYTFFDGAVHSSVITMRNAQSSLHKSQAPPLLPPPLHQGHRSQPPRGCCCCCIAAPSCAACRCRSSSSRRFLLQGFSSSSAGCAAAAAAAAGGGGGGAAAAGDGGGGDAVVGSGCGVLGAGTGVLASGPLLLAFGPLLLLLLLPNTIFKNAMTGSLSGCSACFAASAAAWWGVWVLRGSGVLRLVGVVSFVCELLCVELPQVAPPPPAQHPRQSALSPALPGSL